MSPTPPQVLLNNTLLPAAEARISALSDGFLFGHGVFETLLARDGAPLLFEAHHARLSASCAALDLEAPPPPAELATRITRLLAALKLPHAAVKIVRFRDLARTAELITARPPPYSKIHYLRGFHLKTFTQGTRDGRLTGHKTLNYLENVFARRAARDAGADDALFVTPDGNVLEGSATTVFAVKNNLATTPPLSAGILPGVARAHALALLGPDFAREAPLSLADVFAADEVFVTNALMGAMPVATLDAHAFPRHAPVTTALRTRWLAAGEGR